MYVCMYMYIYIYIYTWHRHTHRQIRNRLNRTDELNTRRATERHTTRVETHRQIVSTHSRIESKQIG